MNHYLRVTAVLFGVIVFGVFALNAKNSIKTDVEEANLKGKVKVFTTVEYVNATEYGDRKKDKKYEKAIVAVGTTMRKSILLFDSKGFLVSTKEISDNGHVQSEERTNIYSVAGDLICIAYPFNRMHPGEMKPSIEFKYDNQRNLIERKEGNVVTRFEYDQYGFVTKAQKIFDGNERWAVGEEYIYSERGVLQKAIKRNYDSTIETVYSNDSQGRRVSESNTQRSTTYKYDKNGLLAEEEIFETRAYLGGLIQQPICKNIYSYDLRGNMIQLARYISGDVPAMKKTYKYDMKKNLVEEIEYNAFGVIRTKTVYSYDLYDNKTSETVYVQRFTDLMMVGLKYYKYEYYR